MAAEEAAAAAAGGRGGKGACLDHEGDEDDDYGPMPHTSFIEALADVVDDRVQVGSVSGELKCESIPNKIHTGFYHSVPRPSALPHSLV